MMNILRKVDGSALFQLMELPAVSRTQNITIGQHFFNNPCPIATMATYMVNNNNNKNFKPEYLLVGQGPSLKRMIENVIGAVNIVVSNQKSAAGKHNIQFLLKS